MKHFLRILPLVLVLVAFGQDVPPDAKALRAQAQKLLNDGNPKEAYPLFEQLVLDPRTDTRLAGNDLNQAVNCLQRLNRVKETDALREKAIAVHKTSWRFLYAAAQSYQSANKYGYIIAGEFERGRHRGGGKYFNSMARDRVRSMQLLVEALHVADHAKNKGELAQVYNYFSQALLYHRGYNEAWRLQYLTNLDELPDYDEGYNYYSGRSSGAPVDPDGNPVYHAIPKSFEDAATDGERWRWCLVQAMELNPQLVNRVHYQFAQFLKQQFGVQTMAYYRYLFNKTPAEGDKSGPYALHTLAENETVARLATGVQRFTFPDEFNYIRILQELVKAGGGYAQNACNDLAALFTNRRQYPRAVEYWKLSIKKFGPGRNNYKQKQIDQIQKNWGRFEAVMTQPAGRGATVEFRFRNGDAVNFTAHALKIDKLLADVKAHLKSNPKRLDGNKINLNRIGYSLVQQNQKQYIDKKVADWDLKLEPRKGHFDKRFTVETPLQNAGAYLLTAKMAGGNTSHIIIWLNDTVILRKDLNKKILYFVGDARTGKPVEKANLAFFGYRQERVKMKLPTGRYYNVLTSEFAEFTNADGQSVPAQDDLQRHFKWLVTATTDTGRLAYLGFSGVWYRQRHDAQYNQNKTFMITDRPVYRPNQSVKFKFWIRKAQYDQEDLSQFANRSYTVRIQNPKQEKVFEKVFTTDAYGGLNGEFALPEDATLGVYNLTVVGMGGGTFRVEEYKKPEFEVKIKAPTEPVMLGEKITATIEARYFFGAPVTKAKVTYKVLRNSHAQNWYPDAPWDWYYGPGYWWFAYDYEWYPGWYRWGCGRPSPSWWPQRQSPPEVVAENEVEIGEDGTIEIEIDTSFAKDAHPDLDHRYEITAEVVDQSRRTIVGKGQVLVARRPFKVYAWVDRGHYRVGDTVHANFSAQTLDSKPVQGKGDLVLYRVRHKKGELVEKAVEEWKLDTDDEGRSRIQIKAGRSGQYRLAYTLTDAAGHEIEGGYVFTVMGRRENAAGFRFNEVELVTDKREYAPGEKVQLRVNTAQQDATVLLFVRPANSVYLDPVMLRLDGKTALHEIGISKKDMPNFFVEAVTIHDGKVHTEVREIIVPPEKRVLNVEVLPSAEKYKPGEEAKVRVKLTDFFGEPFVGTMAMSIYDKSVEYISGGSNVQAIREFFWKWRRHHNPRSEHNLMRHFNNVYLKNAVGMGNLGIFGDLIVEERGDASDRTRSLSQALPSAPAAGRKSKGDVASFAMNAVAPEMEAMAMDAAAPMSRHAAGAGGGAGSGTPLVEATVRTKFADTAFWAATVETDAEGMAEIDLTMPENLTTWKVRTWAMGHGTRVGEGIAEVLTTKNLVLRLQAPRFFVEKDEVVLSANVHNYLETRKRVKVSLVVNDMIAPIMDLKNNALERWIDLDPHEEQRVDWRIKVVKEGEALVRMLALTDEESDAMEMRFPAFVHGMLKTDSFSGGIRPDGDKAIITFSVPEARRIADSRLEIRYSPSLAVAMVDALPYMVEYPYGCTEQTLNRFLPTVLTQKILMDMGLDLAAIKAKRTNLNAQEIGEDTERAKQWERWKRNPVFDAATVNDMVKKGVKAMTSMQLSDGGWGWFSGWGERSYPHTTAYVVHGLHVARENDVAIVPGVFERGIAWLERYQKKEVKELKNGRHKKPRQPWKRHADNLDAFVFMVLVEAGKSNDAMLEFLYEDRNHLSLYAKSMYGIALHRLESNEKLAMIMRNIEQHLVEDDENQTAYLDMPGHQGYWWYWYGSEYEAHAYYLKLLSRVEPGSKRASRLVKYLLNNRKHATYWNSTRDTALCIEAFAEYIRSSGEDKPDMTVEILLDGRKVKEVEINADNLFSYDNKLVLTGKAITSGEHRVEVRRKGTGPLYFNAYLSNFTLEDHITKAGLEIKVERAYYKLVAVDKKIKVAGSRGQALDQKVEKYKRVPLANLDTVKSGDLIEIELVVESKNDYEYILFEDMKAAGFEPYQVRSGYISAGMHAYMELRDERVALFVRSLARGRHSISYRMRAEIPGRFSALPTRVYAMYAPELKGNSDEIKINIVD